MAKEVGARLGIGRLLLEQVPLRGEVIPCFYVKASPVETSLLEVRVH